MQAWGAIVCLAALAGIPVYAEERLAYVEDVRVKSSSRIVSGWEAREGQIPWQLSMRMVNGAGAVFSCGGSIIHPEWGITAAHCTATRFTMVLRAGAVSLTRPVYLFETTQYWNHPLYIDALQGIVQPNDIALLKFPLAISFSDRVQPIRLQRHQDRNRNHGGIRLEASGWGRTWTNGASPENLQWVYLTGDSNLDCLSAYGGSFIIQDSTICASAYNVSSQSTCQGDSGGPLVELGEDGKYTLVGVASFVSNTGCHTAFPAGFIRPGHYHSWYTQITGIDFSNWEYGPASSESVEDSKETSEATSSSESNSNESNSNESNSNESNSNESNSNESNSNESNSNESNSTESNSNESNSNESNSNKSSNESEAASEEEAAVTSEEASKESSEADKSSEAASEEASVTSEEASKESAEDDKSSEAASEESAVSSEEASKESAEADKSSEAASEEASVTSEEASKESAEADKSSEAASEESAVSSEEASKESAEADKSSEAASEEAAVTSEEASKESAEADKSSEGASEEAAVTSEEASKESAEADNSSEAASEEAAVPSEEVSNEDASADKSAEADKSSEAASKEEEDGPAASEEVSEEVAPEQSAEAENESAEASGEDAAEESRGILSFFRAFPRF